MSGAPCVSFTVISSGTLVVTLLAESSISTLMPGLLAPVIITSEPLFTMILKPDTTSLRLILILPPDKALTDIGFPIRLILQSSSYTRIILPCAYS